MWIQGRALIMRPGAGVLLQLQDHAGLAWLPIEKMRPSALEALQIPLTVRLEGWSPERRLPLASMRSEAEEEQRVAAIAEVRQYLGSSRWFPGVVVTVRAFGLFISIFADTGLDVFVPIKQMSPEHLVSAQNKIGKLPNICIGDKVNIRVIDEVGVNSRGKEKFRGSMIPDTASNVATGPRGPRASSQPRLQGYSVFTADRYLQSESSQALEEGLEVRTLSALDLEKQYGRNDRKAYLARKGFSVVDSSTSLHLQQACALNAKLIACKVRILESNGRSELGGKR